MEPFVNLLLLMACCHLSVIAGISRCDSMTKWYGGMSLDLDGNENATISVITLFYTSSRHECSQKCCDADDCTVASYEANENLTCQHYSCEPISECRLTSAAHLGVFTFLTDTGHQTTTSASFRVAANQTETLHGDGGHSKPRKGAQPVEPLLDEEPLKHDNTSVKPRKGAQPDEPLLDEEPLKHDNTSVKPRKGVVDDQIPASTTSSTPEVNLTSVDVVVVLEVEQNSSSSVAPEPGISTFDSNTTFISSSVRPHKPEVLVATARVRVPITSPATHAAVVAVVSELGSVGKSEAEWQREVSASNLHLVIALVLGLMLLFAVLGVITKRVYDQWQRRHYHRMDFLIDGMYHGNG